MIATIALSALLWSVPAPTLRTVAGGPGDLMQVRHVVLRGSNEEIGRQLAEIAVRNHRVSLAELDAQTLAARRRWFQAHYPEVIARSKGVAKVLKGGPNADPTSLPYNLDRDPACSVVFYPGKAVSNGHAMLSRNYDFPKATYAELVGAKPPKGARSMTGDPYVIEMYPDRGYASLYVCAYDLLQGAIDGINEKGVTVALLAVDSSTKRTRGRANVGLGEIDLTRYILDRAGSAREARALLKNVPYYATFIPCHYVVADARGDAFVFEVDENDKPHIIEGKGRPLIVTNHSLAKFGQTDLPEGNSFDRYRRLQAEIAKAGTKVTPEQVKLINHCVAVPGDVRVAATLWHAVYDMTRKQVQISFCLSGPAEPRERRSPYLAFALRPSQTGFK